MCDRSPVVRPVHFRRGLIGRALLAVCLGLLLASCATSGLQRVVLSGPELHSSLGPKPVDGANHGLPRGVRHSPYLSTDVEVVESIARFASQGKVGGAGIRAALFALYQGERELGFYGLEAATNADADRIEGVLRPTWAHNMGIGIARVHRSGRLLLVVWHDDVPASIWEEVNAGLARRLVAG